MEGLYIEGTKSTPTVQYDDVNSTLRIEGQSYPENAFKFYEPLFQWIDARLEEEGTSMALEIYFHMPYINTSSSKCVMMMLEKLEDAYRKGKDITVKWYYDEENELAMECAEEFKEDLILPFELHALEESM